MKKVLGTVLILLGCVGPAAAATYDYNAEFDLGNNPSGVWTYGYADASSGAMTVYNSHAPTGGNEVNNWCLNSDPDTQGNDNKASVAFDQPTWGPGMSWDAGMTCIMTANQSGLAPLALFTAPTTSDYDVDIEFTNRVTSGAATGVFVVLNGNLASPLFNGSVNGFPGSSLGLPSVEGDWTANYTGTLSLSAGDTVAFGVLGEGLHQVAVEATFTEVPEPATMGLLALGAFGMLLRRRK